MLLVIDNAFVQHEKDMRDIVSRGKCHDDVSDLSISGERSRWKTWYQFNRPAQRILTDERTEVDTR